jgi:hypothetical protein
MERCESKLYHRRIGVGNREEKIQVNSYNKITDMAAKQWSCIFLSVLFFMSCHSDVRLEKERPNGVGPATGYHIEDMKYFKFK